MKKILLWSLISIICLLSLISASAAESTYRHWPFDELTEQGAVTPDDSANKAHIRLSGQELCDGVIAKALQFKAGGKGIVLGDLNFQAPATLCFWMRTEIPQSDARILSQLEGSTFQSGALRLVGGDLQVFNTSAWPVVVSGLSNRGIWQHVALVYKADGTVTGYLNGRRSKTDNSAFDFKGVKAGLGSAFLGQHGTPFVGALDDLRIYNSDLGEQEIKALNPSKLFSKAQAAAAEVSVIKTVEPKSLNPMGKLARDEYRIALRPGEPGKAPFWNVASGRFIYAPAFDFKTIAGAEGYRFAAHASDGQRYTFKAAKPYASLAPIWLEIPVGAVQLKVEALNAEGEVIGLSGERKFNRAPMYNGPYLPQNISYQQSVREGLQTLFSRRYFTEWMQPGVPASDYRRTGDYKYPGAAYPAKLIGAIVAGSAMYAQMTPRPDDADKVIAIGRKAADYLISLSVPDGEPMEYFPQTYDERTDVMMNYPAEAAMAYLDFYDLTKEKEYLDAAVKVAQTYQKLQLPNGTWPTVIESTGRPRGLSMLNGVEPVRFFERLMEQYGHQEFKEMRDKAFAYLMANPMKSYMWTSQFEDGPPNHTYNRMSPAQACELAMYLFDHRKDNPSYVDQAIDLMRWSEDQFVCWEVQGNPNFMGHSWLHIPCVMEQYGYMVPVNFSSQHLIETYVKAWQATGNKLYLAKAKDLANGLLHAQELHKGEYPTYLLAPSADGSFEFTQSVWINCGVYSIRSVMRLSEALVSKSVSATDTGIVNGTDWIDTEGNRIVAHEGDIARFNGVFYWYGSSYENNPKGRFGIAEGPIWNGVLVYRSTDLKNWEYMGVCLPRQKGFGALGTTGRSHVMYNERTKKYVMWYRWYLHVPASVLMVAVADHPEGPFTSLGVREMGSPNGFASDMNVFKDDDGKAYVIYCDHGEHGVKGGKGTYRILIDSLSDDYLTSNRDGVVIFDGGCEAPAMIKHKGKYIAVASGVHGWAGSDTKCALADSPLGRYEKQADISEQKTWSSQVTDLIYLKESDTVMALCDQWWIPDKSDINKSRYLFLPLYLDEKTGKVKMEYREKWNPLSPTQTR